MLFAFFFATQLAYMSEDNFFFAAALIGPRRTVFFGVVVFDFASTTASVWSDSVPSCRHLSSRYRNGLWLS